MTPGHAGGRLSLFWTVSFPLSPPFPECKINKKNFVLSTSQVLSFFFLKPEDKRRVNGRRRDGYEWSVLKYRVIKSKNRPICHEKTVRDTFSTRGKTSGKNDLQDLSLWLCGARQLHRVKKKMGGSSCLLFFKFSVGVIYSRGGL